MEQEERLLGTSKDKCDPPHRATTCISRQLFHHRILKIYVWSLHLLLLVSVLTNIYLTSGAGQEGRLLSDFSELRSLRQVLKNEHPRHGRNDSIFSGQPSNISADAWQRLLQPFYFNLTRGELMDAGFSPAVSVEVEEGGFLGSLGVYHELHCLNQFRTFLWSHKHSDFCTKDMDLWFDHLDHCIEVLRLSSMCTPDVSLYTYTRPNDRRFDFLDARSKTPRKCFDWNQLEIWSIKRKISLVPTILLAEESKIG